MKLVEPMTDQILTTQKEKKWASKTTFDVDSILVEGGPTEENIQRAHKNHHTTLSQGGKP